MNTNRSLPAVLCLLIGIGLPQAGCATAQAQAGAEAPNYLTDAQREAGWVLMFNGQDLTGWRTAEENTDSFTVENDCLVANGPRCHLYFGGDDTSFLDFEFQCDVYCDGPSNSGIYFHTRYQPRGWPGRGFEAQVCNGFDDPRKTGSLYAISDIMDDSPAQDGVWFHYRIRVEDNNAKIWINGELVQDWTQPAEGWDNNNRNLSNPGTFALQAHDPGSRVLFKNMMVRTLEAQ